MVLYSSTVQIIERIFTILKVFPRRRESLFQWCIGKVWNGCQGVVPVVGQRDIAVPRL